MEFLSSFFLWILWEYQLCCAAVVFARPFQLLKQSICREVFNSVKTNDSPPLFSDSEAVILETFKTLQYILLKPSDTQLQRTSASLFFTSESIVWRFLRWKKANFAFMYDGRYMSTAAVWEETVKAATCAVKYSTASTILLL